MNNQGLNIFIVDDNPLNVNAVKKYLDNKFGTKLNIFTFLSGKSVLEKIDKNTSMVILDYHLEGENGNEVLEKIKKINPGTEVIMLTSNEEIEIAIESFQKGASGFVIKGDNSWRKVIAFVNNVITDPILRMGREFGLPKFVIIFIATFLVVGLIVIIALQIIPV